MAADIRAAVVHAEHLISALLILARNERGLAVRDQVDLATAAEDVLDSSAVGSRRSSPVIRCWPNGLSVTVTIPSAGDHRA
jgi:hypothetical protein